MNSFPGGENRKTPMSTVSWWLFVFHLLYTLSNNVAYGIAITISTEKSGKEGENGTFIECTINRNGVHSLTGVVIQANISNAFETIVGFTSDGRGSTLTKDGEYLRGRVSFGNITASSDSVNLYFNELLCVDDRDYRCIFSFTPETIGDTDRSVSTSTHIQVQVLPEKPESIMYLPDILDTYQTAIDYYTNPEINDTSYSPIQYNGTTYAPQMYSTKQRIIKDEHTHSNDSNITVEEGNSLTIFCRGKVGNPPGNLMMQLIRKNRIKFNLTAYEIETSKKPENCSFYQNSSFTLNVTATDNDAVFRCAVESFIDDAQMYKESPPINVEYPVSKPTVTNVTNGEQGDIYSSITLSCSSNGNPTPVYSWYRAENTSHPNHWQHRANTRNVTFNITEEGIYRCDVNNTFAGETYYESSTFNHTFTARTVHTTPIMSTSGGPKKSKIENTNEIYYVIGGVGGGALIIIIIVVAIVKCRGKRTKAPTMQQKKPSSGDESGGSLVHQLSKRQTMDANNYCSVLLDDDEVGRGSNTEKSVFTQEETRKHNENYLKEQNEKSSRNEDGGGHQSVEYAMVNKSFKGRSSNQQNNQHQPTVYAQVNKVMKTTSSKPQQVEDHYASGQGIYDHANERRHKQPTESDPYDTPCNINRRRSDKVGSVVEITGREPIKQKQVAKIKPSGRTGYENASMIPDDVKKKKEELNTEL